MSQLNIKLDSINGIVKNTNYAMSICTPLRQNLDSFIQFKFKKYDNHYDQHDYKVVNNMLYNKNGKLDTSKKMINIGGGFEKWRSNITFTQNQGKSKNKFKYNPQNKKELKLHHRKKSKIIENQHNDVIKTDIVETKFFEIQTLEIVDDEENKIGFLIKNDNKIGSYNVEQFLKKDQKQRIFIKEENNNDDIIFETAYVQGMNTIISTKTIESNIRDMKIKKENLEHKKKIYMEQYNTSSNDKAKLHFQLNIDSVEAKIERLNTKMQQLLCIQDEIPHVQGSFFSIPKIINNTDKLINSSQELVENINNNVNQMSEPIKQTITNVDKSSNNIQEICKPIIKTTKLFDQICVFMTKIFGNIGNEILNVTHLIYEIILFMKDFSIDSIQQLYTKITEVDFINALDKILNFVSSNKGMFVGISTFLILYIRDWYQSEGITSFNAREGEVDDVVRIMSYNKIVSNPLIPVVLVICAMLSSLTNITLSKPGSTCKNILESIKLIGSVNLLTTKFEEAIPKIYNLIPVFLIEFVKDYCPLAHEYITFNYIDLEFAKLMQRLKDNIHDKCELKYNAHKLSTFLEDYAVLKSTYLSKYADTLAIKHNLDMLHEIDDIKRNLKTEGYLPGQRIIPTVIWICGESRVGKSTIAKKLAQQFMDPDIPYEKQVYTWSTALPFVDGYNNQKICIINDYMQFSNRSEAEILIGMKDGIDFPLNVSSVDNKSTGIKGEVRFTSTLIIVTSNLTYLQNSADIICTEAFNARRDLVIRMTHKKDMKFNEDKQDYSWCNFEILPNVPNHNVLDIQKITTLNEFYKIIKNKYVNIYRASQNRLFVMGHDLVEDEIFADSNDSELVAIIHKATIKKKTWIDTIQILYKPILALTVLGMTIYKIIQWFYSSTAHIQALLSGDEKTMKRIPQKIRDRVMGKDTSIYGDTIDKIRRNFYRVTTAINYESQCYLRSTNGVIIYESVILLPKHLFYRGAIKIQNDDIMFFYNGYITIEIRFDNTKFEEYDRDYATYDCTMLLPRGKNLEKQFLDTNDDLLQHGSMCAIALNDEGKDIERYQFNYNVTDYQKEFLDDSTDKPVKYMGYGLVDYNSSLTYGDCGAVLLLILKGTVRIIGIHIGGTSKHQYGLIIKKYQLKFKKNTVEPLDYKLNETLPRIQGITYLGSMDRNKVPFHCTKSEINKSQFYECLQPSQTQPAILSPGDRRNKERISPIQKSFAKYAGPRKSMSLIVVDEIKIYLRKLYLSMSHGTGRKLSLDEAINGNLIYDKIDMHTSAGYPYTLNGIRKSKFFDFIDNKYVATDFFHHEFNNFINQFIKERKEFDLLWTVVAKDERRKHKKIENIDTRTFTVGNILFLVLCRIHIGDFVSNYMDKRMQHCGTIGINPYSADFHELFSKLNIYKDINAGDFVCMDGTIMNEVFLMLKMLMDDFYDDTCEIRDEIIYTVLFSNVIVLEEIYKKHCGNDSGWLGTVIINDIGSIITICYCWIKKNGLGKAEEFIIHVKLFVYGDDNVFSVSDKYCNIFNGLTVEQDAVDIGMAYTSSDKTGKVLYNQSIYEVTFLKNYFVRQQNGLIMGALDKNVIQEIPSWIRDDTDETMQMILDSTLRMAWFWGPIYFNEIRNKLKTHCKQFNFLTYEIIEYDVVMDNELHNKSKNFLKMPTSIIENLDIVKNVRDKYIYQIHNNYITSIYDINRVMSEDQVITKGALRDEISVGASIDNYGVAIVAQNNLSENIRRNVLPRGSVAEKHTDAVAILRRPQYIKSITWNASFSPGDSFDIGSVPGILFQSFAAVGLKNIFRYYRGNFHIQFTLSSTTYNHGLAIVHAKYSNVNTMSSNTISSAFIRQHCLLDASDNSSSVILNIPYRYYKNYLFTTDPTDDYEMARLFMTIISSVIADVTVTINGWIDEADFVIPKVQSIDRIMGFTLFGDTSTVINNTYGDIAGNLNPSNITGDQLDMENNLKVSTLDAPIKTVDPQVVTLKRVGYSSNGEYIKEMERMSLYPSEQNLTYFDTYGTTDDEMDINYLCGKWNYSTSVNKYTTSDTPGKIIHAEPVGPMSVAGYTTGTATTTHIACDLIDYISSMHLCWKGDPEHGCFDYYIRFVCSRWHSGRVWVGFYPETFIPAALTNLYSGYGAYLDINGNSNDFIVRVPYISPTDWKYVFNGATNTAVNFPNYFTGFIGITSVTPLVAPVGASTEIDVVVCRRATKGFKLGVPVDRNSYDFNHSIVNWTPTPPPEMLFFKREIPQEYENKEKLIQLLNKDRVMSADTLIRIPEDEKKLKIKKRIGKIDICELIRSFLRLPRIELQFDLPYKCDEEYGFEIDKIQSEDKIIDLTPQGNNGKSNEAKDITPTKSLRDLLRKFYLRHIASKVMALPPASLFFNGDSFIDHVAVFNLPIWLDRNNSLDSMAEKRQYRNAIFQTQYLYAGRKGSKRFRIISNVYRFNSDSKLDPVTVPHKVFIVNNQQFVPEFVGPPSTPTFSFNNPLYYEIGWVPNLIQDNSVSHCVSVKQEISIDGSIVTECEMPLNIINNYEEIDSSLWSEPYISIGITCCGSTSTMAPNTGLLAKVSIYDSLGDDARYGILDNSPTAFAKINGWNCDKLYLPN